MTQSHAAAASAEAEVKSLLPASDQGAQERPTVPCATPGKPIVPKRTMGAVKLGFVAFVAVCGGPFGIEEAVAAAGILPTLIALLVLPVVWGLPQALMTAELSTVYTKNGGYITWVFSGLGKFWGFMNAGNSVCSNWVDLPTYPVLYAEYVGGLFHLNFWGKLGVKLVSLLLVVVLNVFGMEAVSISSIVLVGVMLTPFFVQPFIHPPSTADWGSAASTMDWTAWTGVMLYNYQGWDSLGTIAGEVKNARRSYPLGVGIALVLATVNYAVPVMAGAGADGAVWGDGGLPQIAQDIAPWLGAWVLVGASLAVLGEFNAVMGTSSRALQKMAEYGLVPRVLGRNYARFKTPVPAILLQAVLCGLLMNFSFAQLVVLDTAFNNMSLVLEVAAFLRLKHEYPALPRPYAVPGHLRGAWVCSLPKFAVILFSFYSLGFSWQLGVVVGTNALLAACGAWWAWRHTAGEDVLDADDPVKMHQQGRPPSGSGYEEPGDVEVVPMLDAVSPASPAGAPLAVPAAVP